MSTPAPAQVQPPPAPVETIQVKVNGKSIAVPKTVVDPISGKPVTPTMIQACALAGVDVPHYCYHPKLPVAGNCRMCLVEFGLPQMGPDRKPVLNADGTPKIQKQVLPYDPSQPRGVIACATPVSPGMEIYTDTPAVRSMREAVLESLLINHPLDCPICDQAGECKLQEYSVEYGRSSSRFVETKVHKPKQVDLGPRIMLDDERCILCSRCIRFTRDIIGDDALGFTQRGSYSTLSHYPGKPFDNNYTLNTVDICPVGALTSKDFRFKMRVWFLKETKSICTSCSTGCNITIGSREEKILRYEPRENDAVNSCWMCDPGRLNYKWVGREDRLRHLTGSKAGPGPEPISVTQAVREVGELLRAAAAGSVAIIGSGRLATEEQYLLAKLAKAMQSISDIVPRVGVGDRFLIQPDKNPNTLGARMVGLAPEVPGSRVGKICDGIRAGFITSLLVVGEDVAGHGISTDLLQKLRYLVVVDILPSQTSRLAHYAIPGAAHAEKRGTFVNGKGRIQRFFKAVEPPGDARPETEILGAWLKQVTGRGVPTTHEALFNEMAREIPALEGMTWAGLGDLGMQTKV